MGTGGVGRLPLAEGDRAVAIHGVERDGVARGVRRVDEPPVLAHGGPARGHLRRADRGADQGQRPVVRDAVRGGRRETGWSAGGLGYEDLAVTARGEPEGRAARRGVAVRGAGDAVLVDGDRRDRAARLHRHDQGAAAARERDLRRSAAGERAGRAGDRREVALVSDREPAHVGGGAGVEGVDRLPGCGDADRVRPTGRGASDEREGTVTDGEGRDVAGTRVDDEEPAPVLTQRDGAL